MKFKYIFLIINIFLLFSCQTIRTAKEEIGLTLNPFIRTGQTESGTKYFIQENFNPENRIELRLIVNTGSVDEEEHQKGLAHFVEHMAFNGTQHFKKDRLIKYLESIGMEIGPEINAYTSYNETVYRLSIPADDPKAISNAFQILEDWAHMISFEDDEVEKERGVIIEEWRNRRSNQTIRIFDSLYKILLKGSRYSDRDIIGDPEIIKNCNAQMLKEFYKKWYRPENMAVAVAGDISYKEAEDMIIKHFNFSGASNIQERVTYPFPLTDETYVEIISDPEITFSGIRLSIRNKISIRNSEENYKEYIKKIIISNIFNRRMEEICSNPESLFLNAKTSFGSLINDIGLISFFVEVEEGNTLSGYNALLYEIEKIKQHGFTKFELIRAKSDINMHIVDNCYEQSYKDSRSLANEIVDYYLNGNVPISIEDENILKRRILNKISLDELNSTVLGLYSEKDRVLTVYTPVKSDVLLPTQKDFLNATNNVSTKKNQKREEKSISRAFFDKDLSLGEIVSSVKDWRTGITTLTLSNGAIVVLKPTDFELDNIRFSATSLGGLSLLEDEDYFSGTLAAKLAIESGLNGFDLVELNRLLAGRNVKVAPWIDEYKEGFIGYSSKGDLEIMFQLLFHYFNNSEFNEDSYNIIIKKLENSISNRKNSPNATFHDRVTEITSNGHYRARPIDHNTLNNVNYEDIRRIFKERFADPGDFYYVFTGAFTVDEIKPLILKYIGSIPTLGIKEKPRERGINFPNGVVKDIVNKGQDDQSYVKIVFNSEFNGELKNELELDILSKYFEEMLRVRIRESMSGSYFVSVNSFVVYYPTPNYTFEVSFGCKSGREDELTAAVFDEISKLKNGFAIQEDVDAVVNKFKRNMELNIKDNDYWQKNITEFVLQGRDFRGIMNKDVSMINKEEIINISKKYLREDKYVQVILKPEK